MTNETKISIKTWSAIAMLAAGTLMAFTSLLLPPTGEISSGALWYTGQCFLYAGTIFQLKNWKEEFTEKFNKRQKGLANEVE